MPGRRAPGIDFASNSAVGRYNRELDTLAHRRNCIGAAPPLFIQIQISSVEVGQIGRRARVDQSKKLNEHLPRRAAMSLFALASPARRVLAFGLVASGLLTLRAVAQTPSAPCETASPEPLFALGSPAAPVFQAAAILCGAAGQTCCVGSTCNSGLVCNSSGICRTPCGAAGQRCCTNQVCDAGLACNASGLCRTCGGNGNICCSGNTCSSGLVCSGGRCGPPCGGAFQACCPTTGCGPGLTCSFGTNTCAPCGLPGDLCCPGNFCNVGTCDTQIQ